MLKKVITISLLSSVISACSFNPNPPLEFLSYQEIDGKIEKIRFMQTISDNSDLKGSAYQQIFFGDLPTSKRLGDIYQIYDADGQPMNVIFLMDKTTSLNPKKSEQMKALAEAKTFDFYEFGKGRISHAQFSAKNTICRDFKRKSGVAFTMATSYYIDTNNSDDFYASLISARLTAQREVINFKYHPNFHINDEKILPLIKSEEKKEGEALAQRNLQEKYSLLTHFVCEIK